MAVAAKTGAVVRGMYWKVYAGFKPEGEVVAVPKVHAGRWRHQLEAGTYTLVGTYNVKGERELKFYPIIETVTLEPQETKNLYLATSGELVHAAVRIVMVWKSKPSDLDGILKTPNCDYNFQRQVQCRDNSVRLDKDDDRGRGPETLSIMRLGNGLYRYKVHQASFDGNLWDSDARVHVYTAGAHGKQFEFRVRENGVVKGKWWSVFSINNNVVQECTSLNCNPE